MQFKFEIEEFSDHLVIKSYGNRNTASEYIAGTREFNRIMIESGHKFVIADYREVLFNLSLTEAFNMVRLYERKLPDFKDVTLAAVINPNNRDFTNLWEEISQKKGFNFKVFEDMGLAKKWLREKATQN